MALAYICGLIAQKTLVNQNAEFSTGGDIIALDDTKVAHPFVKKLPFLCWLFDYSDKTHVPTTNWSPELVEHQGKKVYARYNPDAIDTLYIYNASDDVLFAKHITGSSRVQLLTTIGNSEKENHTGEIRECLKDFIAASGKTQATAARELGVSEALLSQFLSGTYKGNLNDLTEKVNLYMESVKTNNRNAKKKKKHIPSDVPLEDVKDILKDHEIGKECLEFLHKLATSRGGLRYMMAQMEACTKGDKLNISQLSMAHKIHSGK